MQSIAVPCVLSPKPHILPTTVTSMLSLAGPCYIFVAKPTGSRSSKYLQGKALPYFSSLVTIATPTRSMRSSRYISGHPQSQHLIWPPFLPVLCCQWLERIEKNHWSWRLISPSLTLSIRSKSSLPITAPVHSPSVNSPPNYLIPTLYFCTPAGILGIVGIFYWSSPKPTPLWPPFLPVLCCQWLERFAKIAEAGDIFPSLAYLVNYRWNK